MSNTGTVSSTVNGTITGNILETVLNGLSAYQIAQKYGFEGDEKAWLNYLNVKVDIVQQDNENYILSFSSGDQVVVSPNLTPVLYTKNRVIEELDFTNKLATNLSEAKTYSDTNLGTAKSYSNANLATAKTYTDNSISNLIGTASETRNTLGELADAIKNNEDVITAINSAITNKVDKVNGKQLSTEDYTTAEKAKLASLENYDDTEVQNIISMFSSGVAGQFATSDGNGGITWLTVVDGNEVGY